MVSRIHPTEHPKLHVDRYSLFAADSDYILYNGLLFPFKREAARRPFPGTLGDGNVIVL